jgi:hypothetical protein
MGMFDYLVTEIALPDGTPAQDVNTVSDRDKHQTKSLDCLMDTYVITAKGELYVNRCEYEWVDDENSLLGGYTNPLPETKRREYLTDYHGDITFYNSLGNNTWRVYTARFTDGRLTRMSYEDQTY